MSLGQAGNMGRKQLAVRNKERESPGKIGMLRAGKISALKSWPLVRKKKCR